MTNNGETMTTHDLSAVPTIRAGRKGAVFVVRGSLRVIEADAFLVPTDSYGNVENPWEFLVGRGDHGGTRQLREHRDALDRDGGVWLDKVGNRSLLAVNVGGASADNSVEALIERFALALDVLEGGLASWISEHRARPLLAMPLIGVQRGHLGAETGDVILALLACIERHFAKRSSEDRGFDVALVCFTDSDYAAVQHGRRRTSSPALADEAHSWLDPLVAHARRGELAVVFGAGASASQGLPLWPELLANLSARVDDFPMTADDLATLDPIDAATILIESAGEDQFGRWMNEILRRDYHALTHGLLASLRPCLAITTNYDQGYELAADAVTGMPATVLPWDTVTPGSAKVLKLHGDLTRGQIVLSRNQFVAMAAFRRPLAGILQERMMIGHVLAVGTSMGDSTLVHAAEEVRALAHAVNPENPRGTSGTVVFTTAQPARARLLQGTFDVATASGVPDHDGVLEAAREVDLFLDWLAMQASSDLSFVLDPRYRALLSDEDCRVAVLLEVLREGFAATRPHSQSELDGAVDAFLRQLGGRLEDAQLPLLGSPSSTE